MYDVRHAIGRTAQSSLDRHGATMGIHSAFCHSSSLEVCYYSLSNQNGPGHIATCSSYFCQQAKSTDQELPGVSLNMLCNLFLSPKGTISETTTHNTGKGDSRFFCECSRVPSFAFGTITAMAGLWLCVSNRGNRKSRPPLSIHAPTTDFGPFTARARARATQSGQQAKVIELSDPPVWALVARFSRL